MIATVYETEKELLLNKSKWDYPKIDVAKLYEAFVERKLDIFLSQEQNPDSSNADVEYKHKVFKETHFNALEKCALVAILPPTMLESLHEKNKVAEIKQFLDEVQEGKHKTGIVMNVVDGKPQFLHRTFEEYFTARWFSRNFESNRSVLERLLFDRTYEVVTDMFDRILAKDCPLHSAVLECDEISLMDLLKRESYVPDVDKGGRNVMHLMMRHHNPFLDVYNISKNAVSLDTTDSVLQWTPLQYAIQSERWDAVELLLNSNVDKSGLDMIRRRAQETDYIDPIIEKAVKDGHELLREYLRSIDVTIHQATSRITPCPM
jgi:hypothetical protein